jgi:hypothetical protein
VAHRSVPLPKPTPPVLTAEQKRRRIHSLRRCIERLETFDPHKMHKAAVSEVSKLEADIDKALCLTFGYGTREYFLYILAATINPDPLITNAALRSTVLRSVGGAGGHPAPEVDEARNYFTGRSIALLGKAISTLEDAIADAPEAVANDLHVAHKEGEVQNIQASGGKRFDLKAVWRRLGPRSRGANQ